MVTPPPGPEQSQTGWLLSTLLNSMCLPFSFSSQSISSCGGFPCRNRSWVSDFWGKTSPLYLSSAALSFGGICCQVTWRPSFRKFLTDYCSFSPNPTSKKWTDWLGESVPTDYQWDRQDIWPSFHHAPYAHSKPSVLHLPQSSEVALLPFRATRPPVPVTTLPPAPSGPMLPSPPSSPPFFFWHIPPAGRSY